MQLIKVHGGRGWGEYHQCCWRASTQGRHQPTLPTTPFGVTVHTGCSRLQAAAHAAPCEAGQDAPQLDAAARELTLCCIRAAWATCTASICTGLTLCYHPRCLGHDGICSFAQPAVHSFDKQLRVLMQVLRTPLPKKHQLHTHTNTLTQTCAYTRTPTAANRLCARPQPAAPLQAVPRGGRAGAFHRLLLLCECCVRF